jgi:hypothetical protein
MKIKSHSGYYAWYCDWCDSRNLTLWTRVDAGQVMCGACHMPHGVYNEAAIERRA